MNLKQQLEFEEGRRLKAYTCTAGHKTIGIGHNLDVKPAFNGRRIPDIISDQICDLIFDRDIEDTIIQLNFVWLANTKLDPARRDAVINMCFQLGINGVMKFKLMLNALERSDWVAAKAHALDSSWAKQTPERAERVAEQLLTGTYYKV